MTTPFFAIQFSLLTPDKTKAPYINTSVKLKTEKQILKT